MKRLTIIKIHLCMAGISIVFLFFTAFSGSLHLLAESESELVTTTKSIILDRSLSKKELMDLFSTELKRIDPNYNYEYIKGSKHSQVSRPMVRDYYTISVNEGVAVIKKHEPSFMKKLMELHKGHGAKVSKIILGLFGFMALGAVLSGLWLGLTSPPLKKITIGAVLSGGVIYTVLFII